MGTTTLSHDLSTPLPNGRNFCVFGLLDILAELRLNVSQYMAIYRPFFTIARVVSHSMRTIEGFNVFLFFLKKKSLLRV